MAIPHYNYYPPAGQVVDASDGRVQWNGRAWMLNGRVYGVPSSHRLQGRPGGPMAGWYYDWSHRAWMEPSAPSTAITPRPRPQPSHPMPQHPQPTAHPTPDKKETCMEKKPNNVLDALVKHPVAPVLGGVLMLATQFTDEPAPPTIPDDLPEATAKQWMMIYNQNQQRFQRRMELYQNLGMVLLGYAEAKAVLDALPPKHS